MRVAKKFAQQSCPACRDGLVCADAWMTWLSRRDDAEALWSGEHGSPAGFMAPMELLDELPDAEEEIECSACGGTGRLAQRPKRAA